MTLPLDEGRVTQVTAIDEDTLLGCPRPRRANRHLPKHFRDLLPSPLPPAPPIPPSPALPGVTLNVWERVCMAPNAFGLFREFLGRPSYDPDEVCFGTRETIGVRNAHAITKEFLP